MRGHVTAFVDRLAELDVTFVTTSATATTDAMLAVVGNEIPLREIFASGLQRFDML